MGYSELHDRIEKIGAGYGNSDDVRQLIRDCIEAVTPERPDPERGGKPDDYFGYGQLRAIDTIEANTKELLG